MIFLGYDLETTGLNKTEDRSIEVGLSLYSTALRRVVESTSFLVHSEGVAITEEVTDITGITQAAMDFFGYDSESSLDTIIDFMDKADAIVAHNGRRFDIPITENWAKRLNRTLPTKLLVDTMTDLPGVKGEQLITMCAKHGFLLDDAHSALADASGAVRLTTFYDLDAVVSRAQSPMILLQSHQSRSKEDNKAARKLGFRWNGDHKMWWREAKGCDVDEITNKAPFTISFMSKDITLADLED